MIREWASKGVAPGPGPLIRGHALGRLTRGSLRISRKPVHAEPGGRSLPRREGRCAISQKPRPPRPVPVRPRVVPPPAPNPTGGAGASGRRGCCAISQKPRPPRLVPVLPLGGSLRNFAKPTSAVTCACPSPGRAPTRAEPGGRSPPGAGETDPRPLTPPHPRRRRETPASASPAVPPAQCTYSQRTPAAPASSCSPTPGYFRAARSSGTQVRA